MDEMLKESLDGFDDLWQRVSGGAKTPPERDSLEDALLALIHDETCAVAYASALAQLFPGEDRTVLRRHAGEARRHMRRLRAEYFIATGVTAGSNEDCRALDGKLPGLRTALLQADEMAARYENAAKREEWATLRDMFAAFAADEQRRARELRALIIGKF